MLPNQTPIISINDLGVWVTNATSFVLDKVLIFIVVSCTIVTISSYFYKKKKDRDDETAQSAALMKYAKTLITAILIVSICTYFISGFGGNITTIKDSVVTFLTRFAGGVKHNPTTNPLI